MSLKILNVTFVKDVDYSMEAIYVYNKLFSADEAIDWVKLCQQYVVHISATHTIDMYRSGIDTFPMWLSEVIELNNQFIDRPFIPDYFKE